MPKESTFSDEQNQRLRVIARSAATRLGSQRELAMPWREARAGRAGDAAAPSWAIEAWAGASAQLGERRAG